MGTVDGCDIYTYNMTGLYYIHYSANQISLKDFIDYFWVDKERLLPTQVKQDQP